MNKKTILVSIVTITLLITVMPISLSNNMNYLVPDLVYSPTSHDFGNVAQGQTYQTTFQIWNGGSSTLTWSLGIVHTWISPNPTSGSSTGFLDKDTVTVTIDTTGLSLGTHSGFVSISANDGGGVRYFNIDCNVVSNSPPNTPSPLSGPSTGVIATPIAYTTSTTDPNGDHIYYGLENNGDSTADWWTTNSYPSGSTVTIYITFYSPGTYNLKVQAKDTHGALSGFSSTKTIVISSSSNNPPNTPSTPIGPSTGSVEISYTFSTSSTDPDDDDIKYGWDWNGDGIVDEWTVFYSSASVITSSHIWTSDGTYNVQVKAEDSNGAQSAFSSIKTVIISTSNNPPNKPTITGPSSGKTGDSYTYIVSTEDSDDDQVFYWIDWDDSINSGWLGPYDSGLTVSSSHIWSANGTYSIKVKSKDNHGDESPWSDPLVISMPKTKSIDEITHLIFRLIQRFPILEFLF